MKKTFKFFKCDSCSTDFMSDSNNPEKLCNKCQGIAPSIIEGAPRLGKADRLGDDPFPKASNEWKDILRKIKKENPNSTIDVK